MLCVCVGDVMDVVFSVCIVTRGAVGASVWEVCVCRHADVGCLCLCVHVITVLNAMFCMTCRFLVLSKDVIICHNSM